MSEGVDAFLGHWTELASMASAVCDGTMDSENAEMLFRNWDSKGHDIIMKVVSA